MDPNTIGVVVGRFQVDDLHAGHQRLLSVACANHHAVLVVLASSGGNATTKNPLPFVVRKDMVLARFPHVRIAEIFDHPVSPVYWSRDLDALVQKEARGRIPVLYGSRDSFLSVYSGELSTFEVEPVAAPSGTEVRARTAFPNTKEARRALIWQTQNRPPLAYRAVALAIVNYADDTVLVAKEERCEGLCSFLGGPVPPFDSDEAVAANACAEKIPGFREGTFVLGRLEHLGCLPIEHPQYRGTHDGVTSSFFRAQHESGEVQSSGALDWVPARMITERLVPWHRPLGKLLLRYEFAV